MIRIGANATLVADYNCYYSGDDAINKTGKDFQEIWEESIKTGDSSKIPISKDKEPTTFRLRHVYGLAKRVLQDKMNMATPMGEVTSTAVYLACRFGLVNVEKLVMPDGSYFDLVAEYDSDAKIDLVTEESMMILNEIDMGAIVNELGIRVIRSLSPDPL